MSDVYHDYSVGHLRVAADLETARLPILFQQAVLENGIKICSPWVTRCGVTSREQLECEPLDVVIKPLLTPGARVHLHHFNDIKYERSTGVVSAKRGQPVEEEIQQLASESVILLLPVDNDSEIPCYVVELDSKEVILVSYLSIHLRNDGFECIPRFVDHEDLVSCVIDFLEKSFERSDRLQESALINMETQVGTPPLIVLTDPTTAAIPTTAQEAFEMGDGWPESMVEEFVTLVEMGTFTYHKRSEVEHGERLLKNKWIFKDKGDRKKSRLVAAGYLQKFGTDYFESYSAVVASESFRVGIALNAFTGHDLIKYDAKNAYVMSDLSPEEQQWISLRRCCRCHRTCYRQFSPGSPFMLRPYSASEYRPYAKCPGRFSASLLLLLSLLTEFLPAVSLFGLFVLPPNYCPLSPK